MGIKRYNKNSNKFFSQLVSVFKRIYQFEKKLLLITFLNIVLNALSPFPTIFFTKYILDALVAGTNYKNVLFYTGLMFLTNYIISNITIILNETKAEMSVKMSNHLANNVHKKCLDMDYEMFNNTAMQERVNLALSLSANNNFVSLLDGVSNLFSNTIVLFGIVFIVAQFDALLIIIAFFSIALQGLLFYRNRRLNMKIDEDSSIVTRYINYLEPLFVKPKIKKDIIVYNMKNYLINKHNFYVNSWMDIFIRRKKNNCVNACLNTTVSFAYQLFAYIVLGLKVFTGEISIGSFTMGINSLNTFMSATNGIAQSFIDVRLKISFINKYDNFLKIPNKHDKYDIFDLESIDMKNINIEFENVSFKYPGSTEYILKNLNIKIKENEKVAVVGENGAGKTTLIMLLTRMYSPTQGRILINGIDIKDIKQESLMGLFSVVHQDFLMLPFSVLENILFKQEMDEKEQKEIEQLLVQCGLNDRIKSMYQGLNTPVTKEIDARGVDMSGGEIQKVAIVRALYKDAPIVILDEPTSALDPIAENDIYQQFAEITHLKTSIYISHRIASTRFCDRIIVLDKGTVAEIGTFDELMSKKDKYYNFYQKQAQYFYE
ncbi:MAG: ABC transporter ATP-binding protein/permease [Lachnospiraceae bacterium]